MNGIDFLVNAAVEGIDLRKGASDYSPEVYAEVLRSWCKHTPVTLDKLRALGAQVRDGERLADYRIAVHGLKGSSLGICADAVGKAAHALELASRAGDVAFVEANNVPLIEMADALHGELSALLAANLPQDNEERPTLASPDTALLEQMLDACRGFRFTAMEEIMDRLEAFRYEEGGGLIEWLREQIDNLEYDTIRQRLEETLGL